LGRQIVASVVVVAASLGLAPAASAATAVIHVLGHGEAPPGATGLYVPGAGSTISRAGAIASLERGKVESSLLGGDAHGRIRARLAFGGGRVAAPAVYVQLPPPGKHPNTRRYLVIVDAPGYRGGTLTSGSTRIDGLVTIPDITQTAIALAAGRKPDIRAVAGDGLDISKLDSRLTQVHHDRGWTMAALLAEYGALVAFAPAAAVVAPATAIGATLAVSALGLSGLAAVIPAIVLLSAAIAFACSARRRFIPVAIAAFLVAYLAVLVWSPETNSLALLGARPDGGGRFYGVSNQGETLLVPSVVAAVAIAGLPWAVPIGLLALVTVGWSKAGADGGGLVVLVAAFAVLFLRAQPARLTWRRAAVAGAAAVAVVFALIGIDAAAGGSSHVTHAVGSGSLLGDFGHRMHLSWASVTRAWYPSALFLACAAVLAAVALRRPRHRTVDAMLVAVVISLLVNDTPVDVIVLGTLGCLALLRFESVHSRRMARGVVTAVCVAAATFVVAGCGSEGTKSATPSTVVGTVKQESPGKGIFTNQGCGSCHTYKPAGPDARGNIGPDLDKLATYAKQAKQPLDKFTHESIVAPNAYIQPGFPKNVMPKSYKSLPASDLKDLVDFLTKPQG
jgi:cytochrome c551/c552